VGGTAGRAAQAGDRISYQRRIEEVEKTFLLQVTAMDRNLEQHIINLRQEHAFHKAEILTQHVGSLLGQ